MQVRRISASGAVGAGAGVAEGADANCGHVRECDGDGGWVVEGVRANLCGADEYSVVR